MTQPSLTETQRVADLLLEKQGSNLRDWLAEQRKSGGGYELIARELYLATSGEVSVSYQTVKRWLIDFDLLKEAS